MEVSKLDALCDFTKHEKEVERYRKFRGEVKPDCTFGVDDNWRMVPVKSLYPRKFRLAGMGTKPNLTKDEKKTTENGKKAATYHVSMPKKVIDESKYKLVHSNHNKHDSFSLLSHVTSM